MEDWYPLNVYLERQIQVGLGAAWVLDDVPIGGNRQEAPLVALDVVCCVDLLRQVQCLMIIRKNETHFNTPLFVECQNYVRCRILIVPILTRGSPYMTLFGRDVSLSHWKLQLVISGPECVNTTAVLTRPLPASFPLNTTACVLFVWL